MKKIVCTGYIAVERNGQPARRFIVNHAELEGGFPRIWERRCDVPAGYRKCKVRVTVEVAK